MKGLFTRNALNTVQWPSLVILLLLGIGNTALAGTPSSCQVGTPGWGMAAPFDALQSYWNPIANNAQDSTESHADCGGAWNTNCQGQPSLNLDPGSNTQTSVSAPAICLDHDIAGEERSFNLNGLTFNCFVPEAILNNTINEKVWILDMPSTRGGSMHDQPAVLPELFRSPEYAYCIYELDEQGLRPMNTVIRGYWAAGIHMTRTWGDLIDKFVITGGSFGSATSVIAPMLIGDDPEFPLAGVWSAAGLEGQRYFDLLEAVQLTNNLLNSSPNETLGEDQEIFRTFFKSIGSESFSAVDITQLAQAWSVPWWMYMGDEDITTHADTDTADLTQAFISAGNASLLKVFVTKYGSHTGDGFITPAFLGDNNDPYNGQTPENLDYLCRDVPLFIRTEVVGKPLPTRQPFPFGNPALTEYAQVIAAQLNPDLSQAASGPNPGLLSFQQRYGYGSQIGHDDSLITLDSLTPGATDLVFGNLEGEIQRVTVNNGVMTPVWSTPTRLSYRIQGLLQLDNQLFAMTVNGTAALIDLTDGSIIMQTGAGHLGTYPRRPILAKAYNLDDTAQELIFITNRQSQIIGIDPLNLTNQYQSDQLGVIRDWGIANDQAGNQSLWVALLRGHAIRLKMKLPGCFDVVALSSYFDDLPVEITPLGEHLLVTGEKQQYLYDGNGVLVPPPNGGAYYTNGLGLEIKPEILSLTNDPNLAMWVHGNRVGITDITRLAGSNTAIAPITDTQMQLQMLSLQQHNSRLYGSTANGTVVEFFIAGGQLQGTPINLPTGAISYGIDQTAGDVLLLDKLEQTGVSLLRMDFENPGTPLSMIGSGYNPTVQPQVSDFQWGLLQWQEDNQEVYLVHEGAMAEIGGQDWTFAARLTSYENDLTEGQLRGFQQHLELPSNVPGSVKLLTPQLTLTEKNYGKVTNKMVLDVNRGAATLINPAGNEYELYYSGSYGVEKRRIQISSGDQLGATLSSGELGWRIAGLELGTFHQRPALFAGTWLSHQQHTGHVYVLNPANLAIKKVLNTGIGSWGIVQADLNGDDQVDTIIGTFVDVQVYDHNLQLLYRSPPLTTAYGAHGLIVPLSSGQPCYWHNQQTSGCIVDELAIGSTGGVVIFDVNQAGG